MQIPRRQGQRTRGSAVSVRALCSWRPAVSVRGRGGLAADGTKVIASMQSRKEDSAAAPPARMVASPL